MSLEASLSYILPKIFHRKGMLISKEKLIEMCNCRDLASFVNILRDTYYGRYIGQLSDDVSADVLKSIFYKSMIGFERMIINYSLNRRRDFLVSYFYRHLLNILKLYLHEGKADVIPDKELLKQMIVDDFSERIVSSILAGREIDVVSLLNLADICDNLKANYAYVRDTCIDLGFLLKLIDSYLLLDYDDRLMIKDVLEMLVYKGLTVMLARGKLWNIDVERLVDVVLTRLAQDRRKYLKFMKRSISNFDSFIEKPTSDSIFRLNKMVAAMIIRKARRLFVKDVFSLGPPFGIILLVENEIRNLSLLASLIERGIPNKVEYVVLGD